MRTISQLLEVKGRDVVSIWPDLTVLDAARVMNDHHIGSLVVCEEDRLVGIITERDILRRVVAEQRESAATLVSEVMTTTVACASPATSLDEARGVMRERRIRHLPVVDADDRVVGIVSLGDLVRVVTEEQEETIRYLEQYMHMP